jgi:UDP-N-acetylglucosamine 2-epimerase (non-hydrolysing)
MIIHLVCAARPNFMKIAPLYHALNKEEWAKPFIVHTGQHYDLNMSDVFFKDLNLPEPDIHLGVGSGSQAEQIGKVMMAYEKVLMEYRPDLVIIVGDVNSTMACALAAGKISYPNCKPSTVNRELSDRSLFAHLEAGLRSFDRSMPEEINRMVTDRLADILWTPSLDADENLIKEGIQPDKIQLVGNIMIDSLEMLRNKIEKQNIYDDFGLEKKEYGLVTIHRPSNVDDPKILKRLCNILIRNSKKIPLIFPIYPRIRKNMEQSQLLSILERAKDLFLPEPLKVID